MTELKVEYCDESVIDNKFKSFFKESKNPFQLVMAFFNAAKEKIKGMSDNDNNGTGDDTTSSASGSKISSFLNIDPKETFSMLPANFLSVEKLNEMVQKILKGDGKKKEEKAQVKDE